VGAEGMVEKERNVMQQIKTLKIILFVTSIALTRGYMGKCNFDVESDDAD